jgi:phosphoglycolate phosphatase
MGMAALDNERVSSYVGNGAAVLIRRALGDQATEAEAQEALEYFLEYYREHDLDFTTLYPGVRESLERLAGARKKMAVLTNKPVRMSQAIVQGLGVAQHFFRVYGGNSFEFKKPHPVGIEVLMEQAEVNRERTLMVGDSSIDVETARNARVACCGVAYGFQPETLDVTPPDLKVDRMEQMVDWVLNPATYERNRP